MAKKKPVRCVSYRVVVGVQAALTLILCLLLHIVQSSSAIEQTNKPKPRYFVASTLLKLSSHAYRITTLHFLLARKFRCDEPVVIDRCVYCELEYDVCNDVVVSEK